MHVKDIRVSVCTMYNSIQIFWKALVLSEALTSLGEQGECAMLPNWLPKSST